MKNIFKKNKKNTIFAYLFTFALAFALQSGLVLSVKAQSFGESLKKEGASFSGKSIPDSGGYAPTGNETSTIQLEPAAGGNGKGFFEGIISEVFSWIYVVATWILDIGIIAINWSLSPGLLGKDGLMDNESVKYVWGLFRDLFNMFFILVLLFSAFSTIFQVDKYSFKKIWLSVLLAVLLINFSFPITRFIIDVSNVMMFSFLDGTSGMNFSVDFMKSTSIEKVLFPGEKSFIDFAISYEIASIIFVFILGVTMVVLGALLMIRLFILIFLIMSSPVGFIFSVFPGMGSFSSKWWNALFSYAFFGPIMVFIMTIAIKIMASMQETFDTTMRVAAGGAGTDSNMVTFLASATSIFIPVVILWIGMGVAKNMGIAGAGAIVDKAQKFSKWGVGHLSGMSAAKFGVHWADRTLAKKVPILSPMAWKAGWKARQGRLDSEALALSTGKMENFFENVIARTTSLNPYFGVKRLAQGLKRGGPAGALREFILNPSDMDRTDRDYESRMNEASKKAKEIEGVSDNSDYVIGRLKSAVERGDSIETHAALKVLAKNNDLNDMMMSDWAKETMPDIADGNWDSDNLVKLLTRIYGKSGAKKSEMARNMMSLSDIGAGNANFGYYNMGHYEYDKKNKKGEFVVSKSSGDRARAAAGKLMNFEPQARQRQLHPDSMFKYNGKGDIIEFSQTGMELLKSFSGDDLAQSDRSRGDLKKRFANAVSQINRKSNKKLVDQFQSLGEIGKMYTLMSGYMNQGMSKADAMNAAKKELTQAVTP